MTQREITCTSCPFGCQITVKIDDSGEILSITGNTCKRGETYARNEITNPVRMITSTVAVRNSLYPVVSVKTSAPVAKGRIFEYMKVINKVSVEAPVKIGDVIVKDMLGTGIDLVATGNSERI